MSFSSTQQSVYEVFEHQKNDLFHHLLKSLPEFESVVVFVRTRDEAHRLTSELKLADIDAESALSNKKASFLEQALMDFSKGSIPVLVTTDATARNLDIKGIKNVINYEFPELTADYLGRFNEGEASEGQIITLVTPKDAAPLKKLEKALDAQLPCVTADDFDYDAKALRELPHRNKTPKKGPRSKPLQNKKKKLRGKR